MLRQLVDSINRYIRIRLTVELYAMNHPSTLSLATAAKAVNRTKPTLLNAIAKGRLSAKKNDKGQWLIDAAELFRAYDPVDSSTVKKTVELNDVNQKDLTADIRVLEVEKRALLDKVVALESHLEREQKEKDKLLTVVDTQTRLLTHEQEKSQQEQKPVKRGWFRRKSP